MYTVETVESLHAYAGRLQRDAARTSGWSPARSASGTGAVRALVRRVRRSR